jgi:hypothetical protein
VPKLELTLFGFRTGIVFHLKENHMRGTADRSDVYPYRAIEVKPNLPFYQGHWKVFNVAKQEDALPTPFPTEALAIAAAHTLKQYEDAR